jgi:hypothetical protein
MRFPLSTRKQTHHAHLEFWLIPSRTFGRPRARTPVQCASVSWRPLSLSGAGGDGLSFRVGRDSSTRTVGLRIWVPAMSDWNYVSLVVVMLGDRTFVLPAQLGDAPPVIVAFGYELRCNAERQIWLLSFGVDRTHDFDLFQTVYDQVVSGRGGLVTLTHRISKPIRSVDCDLGHQSRVP